MLKKLIPHICIILALFTITYVILSMFNPIAGTSFFKVTLILFSIASLIGSGLLISYTRRD